MSEGVSESSLLNKGCFVQRASPKTESERWSGWGHHNLHSHKLHTHEPCEGEEPAEQAIEREEKRREEKRREEKRTRRRQRSDTPSPQHRQKPKQRATTQKVRPFPPSLSEILLLFFFFFFFFFFDCGVEPVGFVCPLLVACEPLVCMVVKRSCVVCAGTVLLCVLLSLQHSTFDLEPSLKHTHTRTHFFFCAPPRPSFLFLQSIQQPPPNSHCLNTQHPVQKHKAREHKTKPSRPLKSPQQALNGACIAPQDVTGTCPVGRR